MKLGIITGLTYALGMLIIAWYNEHGLYVRRLETSKSLINKTIELQEACELRTQRQATEILDLKYLLELQVIKDEEQKQ